MVVYKLEYDSTIAIVSFEALISRNLSLLIQLFQSQAEENIQKQFRDDVLQYEYQKSCSV